MLHTVDVQMDNWLTLKRIEIMYLFPKNINLKIKIVLEYLVKIYFWIYQLFHSNVYSELSGQKNKITSQNFIELEILLNIDYKK